MSTRTVQVAFASWKVGEKPRQALLLLARFSRISGLLMLFQLSRSFRACFLALLCCAAVSGRADERPIPRPPPDAASIVERLGFGSCLHQEKPRPVWTAVIAPKSRLFLVMGDNVYGDFTDGAASKLIEAYEKQAHHPECKEACSAAGWSLGRYMEFRSA